MSENDDHEHEYAMVMPFILTASNGGPFDDAAFVSGWRLGHLDADLGHARASDGAVTIVAVIDERDTPQADLLAMRHRFTMATRDVGDGWVEATFEFAQLEASDV